MLYWRLLLGTLFVAVLVGLCVLDARATTPGQWLFPLAVLLTVPASHEIARMLNSRPPETSRRFIAAGCLLIVFSNAMAVFGEPGLPGALGWPLVTVALAIVLAFLFEIRRYQPTGQIVERLAKHLLAFLYVGLLLSFIVQLRLVGPAGETGLYGMTALASLIAVVKMCDIGAYTVGRLIGKHKLAPRLSPGKTIEGALGGLSFAAIAACITLSGIPGLPVPEIGIPAAILYGLVLGATGIVGDLAESLLKRDSGVKDSSTWMPGFGGVLDILDSLLVTAPVAYLYWSCGFLRS